MDYEKDFTEKKIYLVVMVIVLFACVTLGIDGLTNFNLIEKVNDIFNYGNTPSKIIYVIIGLCALFLIIKRDVYLPFLGDTVYPCNVLTERIPENSNTQVTVQVLPNSNVVYWAAEPETQMSLKLPMEAYDTYNNSGVTKADENGMAVLKFKNPQSYKIPSGMKLEPHVHYRYCKYPGMLSRVETVNLS